MVHLLDIFSFITKEDSAEIPVKLVKPSAEGYSPELDVNELSGYLSQRLPVLAFRIPDGAKRYQFIAGEDVVYDARGKIVASPNPNIQKIPVPKGTHLDLYANDVDLIVTDVLASAGEDVTQLPLDVRLMVDMANPHLEIKSSDPEIVKEIDFFPEGFSKVLFKPARMPYPIGETTEPNWLIQNEPTKIVEVQPVLKDLVHISPEQKTAMGMFLLDTSKNEVTAPSYAVKILKAAEDEDELRLVYGVVLRPDVIDKELDVMTPREVEKACHFYGAVNGIMGFRHRQKADAIPVESYIAPVDFVIGNQQVHKGDWVVVSFVNDDELWRRVQAGEITGYSVGGLGVREKVA